MNKVKVAIIGSGNIGMDLLYKVKRSRILECSWILGRNSKSENLIMAKKMGYQVAANGIKTIIDNPDCCDIVFDATSAEAHKSHAPVLRKLGKFTIDLTPSKIGKLCIPCLNGDSCIDEKNVNMITCGGQAMIPMASEIVKVCENVEYIEMVSTIASDSAGQATRDNIDEYIKTTSLALGQFTNVKRTKAMLVLNPAVPPIIMRNTLYIVSQSLDIDKISICVKKMQTIIKDYVPGYEVVVVPTKIDENIVTLTVQVEGSGDYLPSYAGNLDIITCAAAEIAERYARNIICKEEVHPF